MVSNLFGTLSILDSFWFYNSNCWIPTLSCLAAQMVTSFMTNSVPTLSGFETQIVRTHSVLTLSRSDFSLLNSSEC